MERLNINQIRQNYPGEWALVGELERAGRDYFVKVLCHSPDRKEFFNQARNFMDEKRVLFCYASPQNIFYREKRFRNGAYHDDKNPKKFEYRYQRRVADVVSDVAYWVYAYTDYPTAAELYRDALERLEAVGEKRLLRGILLNWGVVSMTGTRPDIDNAEIQLTRGLNMASSLLSECIFSYELAYVYCFKRQPEKAVQLLLKAIEISDFICNESELENNLSFFARVLIEFVETDEALKSFLGEQLAIFYKTTSLSAELNEEENLPKIVDMELLLRERGFFSLWHLKNEKYLAVTDTYKIDATPELDASSTAFPLT